MKTYVVTDASIEWVCGKRVAEDRTVRLSDAQAEKPLQNGIIAPPEPPSRTRKSAE